MYGCADGIDCFVLLHGL
jgi:hypothetical protein